MWRAKHKYVFLWSELRKSEPKSQVFPTRAQLEPNSSPTRAQNSKPEPYPSPNYLSPFQLYWQKPKKIGEVTVLTENEPPLKRPQLGKVGAVIKANFPCLNWLVSMLIRATVTPPRVTSFQIGSFLLKFLLSVLFLLHQYDRTDDNSVIVVSFVHFILRIKGTIVIWTILLGSDF